MKITDNRDLILVPIASQAGSDYIRAIPTSQATSGDGSVSLDLGFPPECAISVAAGGKRPEMKDVNGVYNLLSSAIQSLQSYFGTYSSALSTAIGGYPLNAIVADATTTGAFWVSTADDNTTAPGAAGAFWQSLFTGLQDALGFTPVQQGGGPNQTDDKVAIGADSTGVGGIRYALMNGTTLTDQGFILRSYAPNPAVGDTAFTNIYYAGGVGHVWAAISASIFGALAWYSDVQTTNTNLTNEVTRATNAEATLTSQVNTKLTTTAPSAAAGDLPLANFYYSGTYTRPWAAISANVFGALAWYADVTTVQGNLTTALTNQANTNANLSTQIGTKIATFSDSQTDSISQIAYGKSNNLLSILDGVTGDWVFAPTQTWVEDYASNGTIAGGYYYTIGSLLIQEFLVYAADHAAITFPMAFSNASVIVGLTGEHTPGSGGGLDSSHLPNVSTGTITATGFELDIRYINTDTNNASTAVNVWIRAVGLK